MIKLVKTLSLLLVLLPSLAMAVPKVSLELKAEIEVTVEENGKMVTKRIPAAEVEPQKTLFYTLNYTNAGDSVATAVEVKNKIPENTVYVLDSAWGEGSNIQFSIDGGKTFGAPSLLTYDVKGADGKTVKKKATPEKYTDIMWVVKEIPAGKTGSVGFNVKVN